MPRKTHHTYSDDHVDVLAFGAHPDDIEFGCGGLLAKTAKAGKRVGIIDLSLAELSTNGTVEERQKEARDAAEILGAGIRKNLEFPNNFFANTEERHRLLVETLRTHTPEMVLIPFSFDRHPDHENSGKLIREAIFSAGLLRYETGQTPHRPSYLFEYALWNEFDPSFIVDISEEWETKKSALMAYKSQFVRQEEGKDTIDTSEDTHAFWEARARSYGFKISARFGEPYRSIYGPIGLSDPFAMHPNLF